MAVMGNLESAFAVIDKLVGDQRALEGLPGVAVGITDRQRLLHVSTSGYADIAGRKAVSRDSLFHIGSISKSFASVVVLQLAEEGKLDLHAPIKDYLPWFDIKSAFKPITLHHLLTHTGGIWTGSDIGYDALGETALLMGSEVTAELGTYFHYSNVGYKMIGLVIEGILGEQIGDVLGRRVLKPLGMEKTETVISQATRERTVEGYVRAKGDRPRSRRSTYVPAPWQDSGTADGSISSSAVDMTAYIRMILNEGSGPGGELLSKQGFSLLTQKAAPYEDPQGNEFYGYGLVSSEIDGHRIIGHTGGMLGFVASMIADMTAGVGVIVLYNCGSYDDKTDLAKTILRVMADAVSGKQLQPSAPDTTEIENAADYEGTFYSGDGMVTFVARGNKLLLEDAPDVPLERRGTDIFYADVPSHDLFWYKFSRKDGRVTEVSHGAYWFASESYDGPRTFSVPEEWEALTGHYRTHDPWISGFRIVVRKDQLIMIDPGGEEHILVPIKDTLFRIDADPRSPERVRFDMIVDGKAVRAEISGCDCFRVSMP